MSTGWEGNLGGWVSENHFAWAHVFRWHYSDVSFLVEDAPYVPPSKPITRWTMRECKEWLKFHSVVHTSNSPWVADLCSNILQSFDVNGQPPKGGLACNVENVLISLSDKVSFCMGPEQCKHHYPSIVDRLVKIFLSCIETMNAQLCGDNDKPFWMAN